MDRARVEACFLFFQKGAALRNENCVSIVRVGGINRYVVQDVFSSLSVPTHYVFVGRLKGSPMNDTAVPRSLAPVSLQQLINRIRIRAFDKVGEFPTPRTNKPHPHRSGGAHTQMFFYNHKRKVFGPSSLI